LRVDQEVHIMPLRILNAAGAGTHVAGTGTVFPRKHSPPALG